MSINPNNIDDLKESFNDLVQRNYEVQEDVNIAIRSEDYLKAVKTIDEVLKLVDIFIKKHLIWLKNLKIKLMMKTRLFV